MSLHLLRPIALQKQRSLLQHLCRLAIKPHKRKVHTLDKIGKREIVGYGWNGSTCYADRIDFPFPPIRFQEPNNEIIALQEKERCNWKKLSTEEKKQLYRYSFCQTVAEMKAGTGEWKFHLGTGIFCCTIGYIFVLICNAKLTPDMPDTFDEDRQKAQLRRIIALEMNPVLGLASTWDYEKNRWK